ncbi:MAG: hypothetical protein ACYC8T_23890 [Myxococcaceae bacterium]
MCACSATAPLSVVDDDPAAVIPVPGQDSGVSTFTDAGTTEPDAGATVKDAGTTPADAGVAIPCTGAKPWCSGWNTRAVCLIEAGQQVWKPESCPAGCFQGACSASACADECVLGQTSAAGTCKLWNLSTGAFVSRQQATSMHDRARDLDRLLRRNHLPEGGVINAHYTDASLGTLARYEGKADSALWTGTALAAQSWRYLSTGSVDAKNQMAALTGTLHRWFNVSGHPGYLARHALPVNSAALISYDCSANVNHCGVAFEGQQWNWHGHTSRDQYTGVMLGYYLAYLATPDPEVRRVIREDVVEFALELAKTRTAVPARIVINGTPMNTTLTLENVVLAPSEYEDGRVLIQLSTSNTADSKLYGTREFIPDMGKVLRQVPLFSWLPDIPRSSSTIMLGAFFRMAILMAGDDPRMAQATAELTSYYDAHADAWLDVSEKWKFEGTCGSSYYGTHIAYIMAYVYATLEPSPARRARISETLFDQKMWKAVEGHKNSYFAFLWGGTRTSPAPGVITGAVAQLSQYGHGARVNAPRNEVANYPTDSQCTYNGQPQAEGRDRSGRLLPRSSRSPLPRWSRCPSPIQLRRPRRPVPTTPTSRRPGPASAAGASSACAASPRS